MPVSPPMSAQQRFTVEWKGNIRVQVRGPIPKIHAKIAIYTDSKKNQERKVFFASGVKPSDDLRFLDDFAILKADLRDNFMVSDILSCRIQVGFCQPGDSRPLASPSDFGDLPSELESLRADLTTHLLKQATDVTLRTSDGLQEFPAHRLLLTARSEVFEKMLSADMREKREGVVCLPDLNSPDLEQLVNYLYGREVKPALLTARLYNAAHVYGLHDLHRRCSRALARGLSVGSVCHVAALAHLHSDSGLFSAAKTFFVDNASAVVVSQGYVQLLQQSPDVVQALAGCLKR